MPGEKRAPVQGFSAGIPWSMHLRAYDAYCAKYGPQPALIDLEGRGCRGGFSARELDMFIPGWREELSDLTRQSAKLATLTAECERLRGALKPFANAWRERQMKTPNHMPRLADLVRQTQSTDWLAARQALEQN